MNPRLDTPGIESGPWSGSGAPDGAARSPVEGASGSDFVGRAVELASLQQFIDEPGEQCLLLAGPRGSGRSRLLRVLQRTRGERTVIVTRRAAASQHPWTGFAALLGALGVPEADVLTGPDLQPSEVVRRTMRILTGRSRSAAQPVVALLDDLDVQDDRSQTAIVQLAARSDGPVRLIASVTWPITAARFNELPVLRLDPLADEDMQAIARTMAGRHTDPVTGDLLAWLSGGVPGVLAANLGRLSAAQRSGHAPLTLPLPAVFPRQAETIAERFGLHEEDLDVLRRVSTAPAVSTDALPALVGTAVDRLESLVARGLLSRESGFVTVPDPELRSELYWQLSSPLRRAFHEAAADAEEHADPDLHDWHRSHLVTEPATPSSLYAAASSLLRKELTLEAMELAERALAHTGVGRPVQQQLEFARELLLHGYPGVARRHLPRGRASMSRRQVMHRGMVELAIRVLAEGDLNMEPVDALVGRYRTELPGPVAELLALAGVLLIIEGAVEEGSWRIEAASRIMPPDPSSRSLQHWAERLRRALSATGARPAPHDDLVPADIEVEIRLTAAVALMWEERYADAREHFAIAMSGWRSTASPWAVRALSLAVDNEIRAGDLTHAAELADRVRRTDAARNPFTALSLAWLAVAQGRGGEAQRLLAATDVDVDLRRRFAVHALSRIRGTEALLGGEPEEAARRLRAVLHSTPDLDPGVLRVHPDLVEAQWRMDDLAGAQRTSEDLAQAVARAPSRWGELALLRCRALLSSDVDGAFVLALLPFSATELPFDNARTHAWYALAAERAGMTDRAAAERRTAVEAFGRLGATAWMRLTRPASASESVVRTELPMLTDTELAVLRMARKGAHNREIASALFMSLRTVELRLTQIYRKFGARSRNHLFALLPDDWPEEQGRSASR